MTCKPDYVHPDTIMTEAAKVFDSSHYHHLPVLGVDGHPVGVISKHDYYQIQHYFTRFGWQNPKAENDYFFGTLLAEEVMSKPPIILESDAILDDAIAIFLKNKVHSILICENGKCVGIVTPFDIIKYVKNSLSKV